VDHAGLKEPPLLLLIDSTLFLVIYLLPQLLSVLKLLSTASKLKTIKDATVETQEMFMTGSLKTVSQTPHANNMLLTTSQLTHASQSISAKTAHGHHAQRVKIAKTTVGLLTTRSITFLSITLLLESTK